MREDLLAMLYRLEELKVCERHLGLREAVRAVGAGMLADFGLWSLVRRGEIDHGAKRSAN